MNLWLVVLAITSFVASTAALVMAVILWKQLKHEPTPAFGENVPRHSDHPELPGPPAIVVNPAKIEDLAAFKATCERVAQQSDMPTPLWYETTESEPGETQAREALRAGASVVVAAGGDGTVRHVATALAGTGTPLGLVPIGTGNLLARNLDLPFGSVADQVTAALTGVDRPMDVGWLAADPIPEDELNELRVDKRFADFVDNGALPTPSSGEEHIFLVIGGLGFDAAMVAAADDRLKAKIGWMAYSVTAVKYMAGRRIDARMQVGGETASEHLQARTIMFANCGRLPGGVVLLPDAQLDDGWLDIATIDTTGGIVGWASVGGRILLQGLGFRREPISWEPGKMTFRRGRTVHVTTTDPEAVQVDGDLVGLSRDVRARVERGALLVRT